MNKIFFDSFKCFSDRNRVFDYEDIPQNKDVFILGSKDFCKIIPKWIKYFDGEHEEHPNAFIDYLHGFCKLSQSCVIDIFTEINIYDRYHGVCKKLLKKDFEYCFQYYTCGEKPYIVVNQEWFDRIRSDNYASYIMIDIIGVKKYLSENGYISKSVITKYKEAIDLIAEENAEYTFITFTDNIFIKADWKAIKPIYNKSYKPEYLLQLTKKIEDIIKSVFGLDSYAIITQGVQLFDNDSELLLNSISNHFFVCSIATPFMELFDIDNNIKNEIHKTDGTFTKSNLYLSEAFVASLKLKSLDIKRNEIGTNYEYTGNMSGVSLDSYKAINLEQILDLIKEI